MTRFIHVGLFLLWGLFGGLDAFGFTPVLPKNHPQHLRVKTIMERLAYASYGGINIPALQIIALGQEKGKGMGAEYVRQPHTLIRVEEKLINVCDEFEASDDALALVIAHELAHHYQGHQAPQRFAKALLESSEKNEGEADHFGIKSCMLSGYESHTVFPDLLNRVYEVYQLPHKIGGYPSLDMRIKINRDQVEFMQPFALLFQAAQFVFIRGKYLEAAALYEDLAEKYPGREVYFNLGTSYALQALSTVQSDPSLFMYPFEFAPESRLDRLQTRLLRGEKPAEGISEKLLKKAELAFQEALKRDPKFRSATISLAAVHILQDNAELAVGLLKRLPTQGLKNPFAYHTVKGIANFYLEKFEVAEDALEMASKLHPDRGRYNLSLFSKAHEEGILDHWLEKLSELGAYFSPAAPPSSSRCDQPTEKQISTLILNSFDQEKEDFYHPSPRLTMIVRAYTHAEGKGYAIRLEDDDGMPYSLLILSSLKDYTGKTQMGIQRGSSLDTLLNKYCAPTAIIYGLGDTQFYHYEEARLIFTVEKAQVVKWATYKISP